MMGIGIDLESVSRIAKLVDRYDRDTLSLLFTPFEIDQCQSVSQPDQHYTICFCAKEAVGKALGTGLADIEWNEIETTVTASDLSIRLSGSAQRLAIAQNIQTWLATWQRWDDQVLVHVLTYSPPSGR